MINIREFYEKDGKMLPGKKVSLIRESPVISDHCGPGSVLDCSYTNRQGISLSLDQYKSVLHILPAIEDILSTKGITVPRPDYSREPKSSGKSANDDDDDEDEADDNEDEEVTGGSRSARQEQRLNHEATSEEDND